MNLQSRRGVYLITPDQADTKCLLAQVQALAELPIACLQYRNKSATPQLREQQASELLMLCRKNNIPLIINDDWQMAMQIGADGAHLGIDDDEIAEARQTAGEHFILGASCYGSIRRAQKAHANGANYVAFGAFFDSATKPNAQRAPLEVLAQAKEYGMQCVAIGGINQDNAASLINAGADMLAVITSVFSAADPRQALINLNLCFETLK